MTSTMPVVGGGVQGIYGGRRDLNEGQEDEGDKRRNMAGGYGYIGTNGVVSTKYSDTQVLWNSTV